MQFWWEFTDTLLKGRFPIRNLPAKLDAILQEEWHKWKPTATRHQDASDCQGIQQAFLTTVLLLQYSELEEQISSSFGDGSTTNGNIGRMVWPVGCGACGYSVCVSLRPWSPPRHRRERGAAATDGGDKDRLLAGLEDLVQCTTRRPPLSINTSFCEGQWRLVEILDESCDPQVLQAHTKLLEDRSFILSVTRGKNAAKEENHTLRVSMKIANRCSASLHFVDQAPGRVRETTSNHARSNTIGRYTIYIGAMGHTMKSCRALNALESCFLSVCPRLRLLEVSASTLSSLASHNNSANSNDETPRRLVLSSSRVVTRKTRLTFVQSLGSTKTVTGQKRGIHS